MYRLLIIDDEPLITKGLHSKIRRTNLSQIGTVYESNDPVEALASLNELNPHIIITDMKMPSMTGIEFIQTAKTQGSSATFIVLSGHDDYDYVRESFQLGAIDYLLKPVSIEDLTRKLQEAIGILENPFSSDASGDYQLSSAINSFISDTPLDDFDKSVDYISKELSAPFFQMASVSMPHGYDMNYRRQITKDLLALFDDSFKVHNYYDALNNSILVFNYIASSNQFIIVRTLSAFLKQLKEHAKPTLKIALTEQFKELNTFKTMISQLDRVLSSKIIYAPYSLMIHDYNDTELHQLDKSCIRDLTSWFQIKDFVSISYFIDHFFILQTLDCNRLGTAEKVYYILIQKFNELFNTNDLIQSTLFAKSFQSFDSLTELRLYLKECLFKVQRQLENKNSSSMTAIETAINFIHDHLSDDIDMAQVSNHLSMNYSYFSKLFKDTMHISFKKYLIQARMDYAKELLNDPTSKVYDIASKTGYDNAQNFSRAFKNHFGYSPKKYRNR